jgi:hypothetical protein
MFAALFGNPHEYVTEILGLREKIYEISSLRSSTWKGQKVLPMGVTFSASVQTCPVVHTASFTKDAASLFRGESSRGLTLTTNYHLAPRVKKEYSCTSTPLLGLHGLF